MATHPPTAPVPPLSAEDRLVSLRETLAGAPRPEALSVFAYGSLIWSPCFETVSDDRAVLPGYQRDCSIWTVLARGTPENPGLGFGLEGRDGAACHGVVFRLPQTVSEADLLPLWEREMWTDVYAPTWVDVTVDGIDEPALTFVLQPDSVQYAGGLSLEEKLRYIESAHGKFGSCRDMVLQTAVALRERGIPDPDLDLLAARLGGAAD